MKPSSLESFPWWMVAICVGLAIYAIGLYLMARLGVVGAALYTVYCVWLGWLILSAEHEIMDGILQLCLRQPGNLTVRMLLAQTLRQMGKVRPEVARDFREKIELLQRDHPLKGEVGRCIGKSIAEALGA